MSLRDQIYDLMQDGDSWTAANIASPLHLPTFVVESEIRKMTVEGIIVSDGKKNGQFSWRRKALGTRQQRLDDQVDAILESSTTGHQPNDMTKVSAPHGDINSPILSLSIPFNDGWSDEPHWILDAMGWARQESEGDKSAPPMDSPIRWMGGKSKMLKDLIRWYPEHSCYVEAFGGSLKPFFAKKPSKVEVVNDFYTSLINFWRVASQWPEELADACNNTPASRTLHRLYQREDGRRTPWERAVMFGSLIRFSFNGKPWASFGGSPTDAASRINKELLVACAKRLSDPGVFIENLDFRTLIKRYNKKTANGTVFFYLDPPYYKTEGYANKFPDEWHRELAELMVEIHESGNKVLMTNSPHAKDAYRRFLGDKVSAFFFESYTVAYTASGSTSGRGNVEETIISNFKLKVSSQKMQSNLW